MGYGSRYVGHGLVSVFTRRDVAKPRPGNGGTEVENSGWSLDMRAKVRFETLLSVHVISGTNLCGDGHS